MQFFRRNKSHAAEASVERSRARSHGELLVEAPGTINRQHPAFPPPAGDPYKDDDYSSYQQRRFSRQRYSYHEPSQSQIYQDYAGDSSRSSRNSISSAKPAAINLVPATPLAAAAVSFDADAFSQNAAEQSWPLPAPGLDPPRSDQESRKLKKGLFSRHSVKRKSGSPRQQPGQQHQNTSQQSITSDGGASGGNVGSTAANVNKEVWNPSSPDLQLEYRDL